MFSVTFSPDGKLLATGDWADLSSGGGAGAVRLWDVQATLKPTKSPSTR